MMNVMSKSSRAALVRRVEVCNTFFTEGVLSRHFVKYTARDIEMYLSDHYQQHLIKGRVEQSYPSPGTDPHLLAA